MNRRHFLGASTALFATAAFAAPQKNLTGKLKVFIPANVGGGWDATGRSLGAAVLEGKDYADVEYINKGGKGGVPGLQNFVVENSSDPHALLVGGMVMLGAIALQRPIIDLTYVQPVMRLTGDYLVLVTAPNSPLVKLQDLVAMIKDNPQDVAISGGSAGGIDHIMASMLAFKLGMPPNKLKYLPTTSGADSLKALTEKKALVAIAGYSEFKDAITSGKVRALGISSKNSKYGIASLYEADVRIELSNWRGVFAGNKLTANQLRDLRKTVEAASNSKGWREALGKNSWEPKPLLGKTLDDFVRDEQKTARAMVDFLGLKA